MHLKNKIGVMLGRCSPYYGDFVQGFPENNWKNEFKISKNIGFNSIEWTFGKMNACNPIVSKEGRTDIKKLLEKYQLDLNSITINYFMINLMSESKLNRLSEQFKTFTNLISYCKDLSISYLIIPILDNSTLSNKIKYNNFIYNLKMFLDNNDLGNIWILLESDFSPKKINLLLKNFVNYNVAINYDTGNSSANDFIVEEEFESYGTYIKNIHIKDRKLKGESVNLGEGNFKFKKFYDLIKK